jgi:hypothetical protein
MPAGLAARQHSECRQQQAYIDNSDVNSMLYRKIIQRLSFSYQDHQAEVYQFRAFFRTIQGIFKVLKLYRVRDIIKVKIFGNHSKVYLKFWSSKESDILLKFKYLGTTVRYI